MRRSYYDYLPRGYFNDVYGKVAPKLTRGQNVLVSAMYGCGGKTFCNLFLKLAERDRLFDETFYYDPEIQPKDVFDFVKDTKKSTRLKNLMVIRYFEKTRDKIKTLEKLNSLRQPNQEHLTYLVITNHEGITNREDYSAATSQFFSDHYCIRPFDYEETIRLIEINNDFYHWNVSEKHNKKIFEVTGGIPRLVKYVVKDMAENGVGIDGYHKLITNPAIIFQLKYMVNLLMTQDKKLLYELGITNNKGNILSSLLQHYYENYVSSHISELYPDLSDLETRLLTCLYENENNVVSVDKIGDLFEMMGRDFSLWAIYKLMSRLKPKIKGIYSVKNIKGKGYILRRIA